MQIHVKILYNFHKSVYCVLGKLKVIKTLALFFYPHQHNM
jgi:hypothetical protein